MNEKHVSVGSKSRHVRKLEFGQVLRNLDSTYGEYGQDKNGRLIIDDGTSRIPTMSRIDFVQKWIGTHVKYPIDESSDDLSQISDSPEDHSNFDSVSICQIENKFASLAGGKPKKRYREYMGKKENVDDNKKLDRSVSGSDNLPLQPKDVNIQSSPILGKSQIRQKRNKSKQNNKPKCDYYVKRKSSQVQVQSEANALEISIEEPPAKRTRKSVPPDYNDSGWITNIQRKNILPSPKIFHTDRVERPGYSELIEDGSSSGAKSNERETATHLSMIIDDSDTEDKKCNAFSPCNLSPSTVKSRDSDVTYFSKAENLKPPASALISQSISSATHATNQHSESIAISTETSPTRAPSDPTVLLRVLDSGKKKKKPKRGSLVEKLLFLINSEKSSVRIWHHCQKHHANEKTNNPYVTIHVESSTLRFDKQLLKGIVVEDFANLLPPLDFEGNNERNQSQQRKISILITPEMAGKIEMTSNFVMRITPPWILLDRKNLFLAVSYVTIVSFESIAGITMDKPKVLVDKSTSLETFNCSCNLDTETFDDYTLCRQCIRRSNEPNVLASLVTNK